MEKIVIWGTGKRAGNIIRVEGVNSDEILCFVDNNPEKWGKSFAGKPVIGPQELKGLAFDAVVVGSTAYEQIRRQLEESLGIESAKIKNSYYFNRRNFLNYYGGRPLNAEEKEVLDYVRAGDLEVFNYPFVKAYETIDAKIHKDNESGLLYTDYKGKRMYFARSLDTQEKARTYYRSLFLEQDPESPHCYARMTEKIKEGSVVLDGGVAEGNFALDIIDRVKRLYLVEPDPEWAEALRLTMRPYEEKTVLVEKALGSADGEETVSLDTLLEKEERVDFIKLDIEGSETEALEGAEKTLEREGIFVTACAYHREGDEAGIREILERHGFTCGVSRGYMVFIQYNNFYRTSDPGSYEPKKMVRGLVFGRK